MRKSLVLATLLVLCCSMTALAGIPDPTRTGCELKGQSGGCVGIQYKFRPDGGLDCLSVCLTLRDAFDEPVSENVSVTLTPNAGTVQFCTCCPAQTRMEGVSAVDGTIVLAPFCCIAGFGTLDVCITAEDSNVPLGCKEITFTSTDLNAGIPACGVTDVIDLGLWAGAILPYDLRGDYNCDGTVDVVDLGLWAGGLEFDCSDCPHCP